MSTYIIQYTERTTNKYTQYYLLDTFSASKKTLVSISWGDTVELIQDGELAEKGDER